MLKNNRRFTFAPPGTRKPVVEKTEVDGKRRPFQPVKDELASHNERRKTTICRPSMVPKPVKNAFRMSVFPLQVPVIGSSNITETAAAQLELLNESEQKMKATHPPMKFGFLRPTKSSLAKCKPRVKGVNNTTTETQNESNGGFKKPLPVLFKKGGFSRKPAKKGFCSTANSSQQDSSKSECPEMQTEADAKITSTKTFFQIYESGTSEESVNLSVSAIEKLAPSPPSAAKTLPNIVETPKFPCTRSSERQAKRRLQYRLADLRDSSPPPSFDFTVNKAVKEPRSVSVARSYDVFCTPILNLNGLNLDSMDESVYYTPCAET